MLNGSSLPGFCAGSAFLCPSSLASLSSGASHFLHLCQHKQLWCLLLKSMIALFFSPWEFWFAFKLASWVLSPKSTRFHQTTFLLHFCLDFGIFAGIWGCSLGNTGKSFLWSVCFFQSISTPVFSCFPAGKLSKSWVNTEGRQDDCVYVIFQTWNNLRNYIVKLPAPVRKLHFHKGLWGEISKRNGGYFKTVKALSIFKTK